MNYFAILLLLVAAFGVPGIASAKKENVVQGDFFRVTTVTSATSRTFGPSFSTRMLSGGGTSAVDVSETLLKEMDHKKALKELSNAEKEVKFIQGLAKSKRSSLTLAEWKQLEADHKVQKMRLQELQDLLVDGKAYGFTKKTLSTAKKKGEGGSNTAGQISILSNADRVSDISVWLEGFTPALKARAARSGKAELISAVESYEKSLSTARTKASAAADLILGKNPAAIVEGTLVQAVELIRQARTDTVTAVASLRTLVSGTSALVN